MGCDSSDYPYFSPQRYVTFLCLISFMVNHITLCRLSWNFSNNLVMLAPAIKDRPDTAIIYFLDLNLTVDFDCDH